MHNGNSKKVEVTILSLLLLKFSCENVIWMTSNYLERDGNTVDPQYEVSRAVDISAIVNEPSRLNKGLSLIFTIVGQFDRKCRYLTLKPNLSNRFISVRPATHRVVQPTSR